MKRLAGALLLCTAAPALARDSLGVFDDWAAFRDPAAGAAPMRCYAIAEPVRASSAGYYATIGHWPQARVRGQLNIRRPAAPPRAGAPARNATLTVGDRTFPLLARGTSLWAPDARTDAALVAAMRSATTMRLTSGRTSATWRLRGAATAIDAAALGCVRRFGS